MAKVLTPEELIQILYDDRKKRVFEAYLLLISFGAIGGHRSYLQFQKIAVVMCCLTLSWYFAFPFFPILAGFFAVVPISLIIFDLIYIPKLVANHNRIMLKQLRLEYDCQAKK